MDLKDQSKQGKIYFIFVWREDFWSFHHCFPLTSENFELMLHDESFLETVCKTSQGIFHQLPCKSIWSFRRLHTKAYVKIVNKPYISSWRKVISPYKPFADCVFMHVNYCNCMVEMLSTLRNVTSNQASNHYKLCFKDEEHENKKSSLQMYIVLPVCYRSSEHHTQ